MDGRDPEQELSEGDHVLSHADQAGSDLDRKSSEVDRASSLRDQHAADRDQRAADLDQEASDWAHDAGGGSVHYERTRRTRSQTTIERDRSTHARSEAALVRDETADRRDREAEARDAVADARDEVADTFDTEVVQLDQARPDENGPRVGLQVLLGAAQDRKRAAAVRAKAAAGRQAAARDRALARQDRIRAAADRRQAAEELASEGADHLTGALRRGVGVAAIERELDRTRRTGEQLVLAFVDVDGLKAVNDTHGHQAGDDLLRSVVDAIHQDLRAYDIVVRYGGDEFVCTLAGQGLEGIRGRFDRINAEIAAANDGAGITVGLAEATAGITLETLIAQADHAMLELRRHS